MFNSSFPGLLESVTAEVFMATLLSWCHRRWNVRELAHAIFVGLLYMGLIGNGYNILTDLTHSFPQQFTWTSATVTSMAIMAICVGIGVLLDRVLSRVWR